MASIQAITPADGRQRPPVVAELEALFAAIPDTDLLAALRGPVRCGPKGYAVESLWHAFLVYYYLGLPSVSDLIRLLQDNPYIARACGFDTPDSIPSQATFSRFNTRLSGLSIRTMVKRLSHTLTARLYDAFPGFGQSVAVDSTDIRAWSNGAHSTPTDPDAGWCVKKNPEGNRKFVWGYKVHALTDTATELPIVIDVTAGNVHDSQRASPLMRQAKAACGRFFPEYFIADAAYSSDKLRQKIEGGYSKCRAVIDPNARHKKAVAHMSAHPEYKAIYNQRTAIERMFGRLKSHRKLNAVRVRGKAKVLIHATLAIITVQAQALATGSTAYVRRVA